MHPTLIQPHSNSASPIFTFWHDMIPNRPAPISPGVLSQRQLDALISDGTITSHKYHPPETDASAFDLSLGSEAWQLPEGQRPSTREFATLTANSTKLDLLKDSRGEHFLLKKGQIYLVKLDQHLKLPLNLSGRATGKSSIGRLDIITRLLTDSSREYDVVEGGYCGPLFTLILPQTFPIIVSPGSSLNQLRLFSGPPHASLITKDLIGHYGTPFWYVPKGNDSTDYEDWDSLVSNEPRRVTADPTMFDLTVDLADPDSPFIFKAAPSNGEPVDLRKPYRKHDPSLFFQKVEVTTKPPSVVLAQDGFYIMKSKERLNIPTDVAVEVVAISERIGDIRIHYAGFAHPGFGRHPVVLRRGTPLIFEVRATDMATKLYDSSLLARIQFFRMSEATPPAKSAYDEQELKLSDVFAAWPSDL